MSKNMNKKTTIKKVVKKELSDSDNEIVQNNKHTVVDVKENKLNTPVKDLKKIEVVNCHYDDKNKKLLFDLDVDSLIKIIDVQQVKKKDNEENVTDKKPKGQENKVIKVGKYDLEESSDENESDEDDKKESQREKKNKKFEVQRKKVFDEIKSAINYNEDERTFSSVDLNKEETRKKIIELYPEFKLFFHCSLWNRVNVKTDNSHFTMVKNIFRDFGFSIIIKKNYEKTKNGKTLWYKYFVVDK